MSAGDDWWNPFDNEQPDFDPNSPIQDSGYQPMDFGGQRFQGPGMQNPFQLASGINAVAAGRQIPGQTGFAEEDGGGAFSQLGDAIGGIGGAIGGGLGKVGGAVKDLTGWDDMKGMEKAWLLSQAIGTGADIYSSYKQGKQEDEERKKRQRSAENLRPFIQSMLSQYGG